MWDAPTYKVVGCYDTETTNVQDCAGNTSAFVVLHQLGVLDGTPIEETTAANVEEHLCVSTFRDVDEAWRAMLKVADDACGFVPVIAVHNLSFDMHAVAEKLIAWPDEVRITAKSPQKPITITLVADDRPVLRFWDTLGFSGTSLERMGLECGYPKAVGKWDYASVRGLRTPLTPDELTYAKHDLYALTAWLGHYLKKNPLIAPEALGDRCLTKTGAVRQKRRALIEDLRAPKSRNTVGQWWHMVNDSQALRKDEILYTVQACTRGGLTFVSSEWAGTPIEGRVEAYDATSQHPAQMVSHMYPVDFAPASVDVLALDAEMVADVDMNGVLDNWAKPFSVAFCAEFEFKNLRLRPGTVYARDGIAPLAYARLRKNNVIDEEAQQDEDTRRAAGYADHGRGVAHSFGKVEGAQSVCLWLTELGFWEVSRAYEWDACAPVRGVETGKFVRPTDLTVLSVMEFYGRKNTIKQVKKHFHAQEWGECARLARGVLPDYFVDELAQGAADAHDLDDYYLAAKADLNALFGIEATNEARRDIVLTSEGLEHVGVMCADNLPKHPKAWYQCGQRIVGWSRVAQCVMIEGLGAASKAIINGDTDSLKLLEPDNIQVLSVLNRYASAVDKARNIVCKRVEKGFPDKIVDLSGIGHYEHEATYRRFCAGWNKAYLTRDEGGEYHITLAGVPASRESSHGAKDSLEDWARAWEAAGHSFAEVCGLVCGYNVTLSSKITHLLGRSWPQFGARWRGEVEDWRGNVEDVDAPEMIGLTPMSKVLGGFDNPENRINAARSIKNNDNLNIEPVILDWDMSGKEPKPCLINLEM